MSDKTITVKGVGTASVKPDYVIISLHLTGEDSDYVEAINKSNNKINLLKTAIKSVGFIGEDLKTVNFSARSVYKNVRIDENYAQQFSHYSSEYDLTLSFDFTQEMLSAALTAIANSGADASFSIDFTVKEPQKVEGELLVCATENARYKAEVLCKALGKQLGNLLSINYDWNTLNLVSRSSYAAAEPRMLSAAAVPQFTPDDINSQDSATFVWEIV